MYRKSELSAAVVATSMIGEQMWVWGISSVAAQSRQNTQATGIAKKTSDAKVRALGVVTATGYCASLGRAFGFKRDSDRATQIYL